MEFLARDNQCGQNILRLASRGSAIIAELLRLSANIPDVFILGDKFQQNKYTHILFDFQYLRQPEECEKKINEHPDLLDLDQEFQDNYKDILSRFYKLFESIWRYQADLGKFFDDVSSGYYIRFSLETILQEVEGLQLVSEALYLYGVMLLLLEEKIPGLVREKLLIATYRQHGDGGLEHCEEVFKLCRNTGYVPNIEGRRPKNHPESFFARFPPNPEVVRLVVGRLQTDDIYLMANAFPSPEHRSFRLANQAAMLFVIMYFAPDMLKHKATMREIVDKYFNDNWVISTYMGITVDLTVEWQQYGAAQLALENVLTEQAVKQLSDYNVQLTTKCLEELKGFLKEGVLQQDFLLDHLQSLLHCTRRCNIALRWRLLHRKCKSESFRKIIEAAMNPQLIVTLLLNTSQLEYQLKGMLQQLLDEKDTAWTDGKAAAAERIRELAEFFSGEKLLSKVKRDDNLMRWFGTLAEQVSSLTLDEGHATATGRRIQSIVAALEDVEQFEAVDTNMQIKSYLHEIKEIFTTMIRTVNVKNDILTVLETISDLTFAWKALSDYIPVFHERIGKDPSSVVLLRAAFLKAASILDVPLVRISASDSPDAVSVAEYYSTELVEFVRVVLEIIPISVFRVLDQIVQIQTQKLSALPSRLEAKDLKDFAQLDVRCELAKLTHQVSIFTEGILVMEKTLLGVIQVDPRQILEEGLRRELVRLVSQALNKYLAFKEHSRLEINENMSRVVTILEGLKRSIEYLQDYIAIPGLKIFQQEFSRVINYFTEQESNRFLKKKTFDGASQFQTKAIPIPRLVGFGQDFPNDSVAITFMGRVMHSLIALTDPASTVYAPECTAWFVHSTSDQKIASTVETCGVRTFALLERSIGVIGLRGLDRLLSFHTVYTLNNFSKFFQSNIYPLRAIFDQVRHALFPERKNPSNAIKIYLNALKKVEHLMLPLAKLVLCIGQSQLIRRQISNVLQFGCQMDAHILYQALDTFNRALFHDLCYCAGSTKPFLHDDSPLLAEITALLESCGLDDPTHKIYLTTQPLEGLPEILFLLLLTCIPNLDYDPNFGSLVRKKSKVSMDGVPLVVGIACVAKQFHPAYILKLLAYLGQFLRVNLQNAFAEAETKSTELPKDVINIIIFVDQLCLYSSIPRSVVHKFVPPYVFDCLKLCTNSHSRR